MQDLANTNVGASQTGITPSDKEREFFAAYPDESWLPRLKLLQGTNPEVGEMHPQTGEPLNKQGDWYLDTKNKNLGRQPIVCVCARRSHALLIVDNKKKLESFNFESPIFKQIMATPSTKDQSVVSTFSIGDFLLWLPEEDVFCTFYPGKKTFRPTAFEIIDYTTKPDDRKDNKKHLAYTNCFKFGARLLESGPKYRSFIPVITPLEVSADMVPPKELTEAAVKMFYGPVEQELAAVAVSTPADR